MPRSRSRSRRLSEQFIRLRLRANGQAVVVRDSVVPGLRVVAHPSGARTWEVVKRLPTGKVARKKIGDWPSLDVDAARKEAERVMRDLRRGVDPRVARPNITVDEMIEDYAGEPTKRLKRPKSPRTHDMIRWVRANLAPIGDRPAVALTRPEVEQVYEELFAAHPTSASRTIGVLRAAYNVALRRGWIDRPDNPCVGIELPREEPRTRILDPEHELGRFLEALDHEPCETQRDALLLALLTGQRKSDILKAEWDHVDLAGRRWVIPELTKRYVEHEVHLNDEAVELLRRRAAWRDRQVEQLDGDVEVDAIVKWVFPSPRPSALAKGLPLGDTRYAMRRVLRRAGIKNVTTHDLRRTFGSLAVGAGAPKDHVGAAIGHAKGSAATDVYVVSWEKARATAFEGAARMIRRARGQS